MVWRPGDFRLGLYESTTRRVVTHLTHLEDLVLTEGPFGATKATNFLFNLVALLQGQANAPVDLSVKMDGAPALVFGIDPSDGQFFVATKAAFSKTPKLVKGPESAHHLYGHDRNLANTLQIAYAALRDVQWPGIMQGDLLFTTSRKTVQTVHGEPHVTFTPNTLTYAVPLRSELGQRLAKAHVGIAVHTRYAGTFGDLTASPFNDHATLTLPPSLAVIGGSYRSMAGTLGLTADETADLKQRLATLQHATVSLRTNPVLRMVQNEPVMRALMLQFQNELVRNRFAEPPSVDQYLQQLAIFLGDMRRQRIRVLKTPTGHEMALARLDKTFADLAGITNEAERDAYERQLNAQKGVMLASQESNRLYLAQRNRESRIGSDRAQTGNALAIQRKALAEILHWQRQVVQFKGLLLTKLKAVKSIDAYIRDGDGLIAGSHEGFVACDATGTMVKLVDRSAFSLLNFTRSRFAQKNS